MNDNKKYNEMIDQEFVYMKIPMYAVLGFSDVSISAKCIWAVIYHLCDKYGFCTASNDTLSSYFNWSIEKIAKYINELDTKKLIKITMVINEKQHKPTRIIYTKEHYAQRI